MNENTQVIINADEVETLAQIAADLHAVASNAKTADPEMLALALSQVDRMLSGWAEWLQGEQEKQADEATQYEIFMSQPPKPEAAKRSHRPYRYFDQ